MAGRKTKFSPQLGKAILEALSKGASIQMACDYAGIGRSTFYSWRAKGEAQKTGQLRTFVDDIAKASAQGGVHHLGKIFEASDRDWRASAWILERRWGYKKESSFDEKPEPTTQTAVDLDPISILEAQASQLVGAIQSAESSQSWQAYAALQRQLLSVVEHLRALRAESEMTDSVDQMTNQQMIDSIVGTILQLPPVLRQQLEANLSEFNANVVTLRSPK